MRMFSKIISQSLVLIALALTQNHALMCEDVQPKLTEEPSYLVFDVKEELQDAQCQVQGTIPIWLNGTLFRNGPAKFTAGKKYVDHWFDGLAMIHSFTIDKGRLFYSNRYLRSEAYTQMVEKGAVNFSGFAQDPNRTIFKKIFRLFIPQKSPSIQNANVNIARYANHIVALTETPLPVQFDEKTLQTLQPFDYSDELPKKRCFESAHPYHDPIRKETINYLVRYGRHSFYVIWKMKDGHKTREIISEIPVREPSYMHSFAVTQNYVILTEYPLVAKPQDLLLKGKAFIRNFTWKPELGTIFNVIDKKTGQVVFRLKGPSFFAFHHVNAYEKDDTILIDLITYPDSSVIMRLAEKNGAISIANSKYERFILDLKAETIERNVLFDDPVEMPTINSLCSTKLYRYAYAADIRFPETEDEERTIVKFDLKTHKKIAWVEKGSCPSEPLYIQHPQAKDDDEDNGVILSVIHHLQSNKSFLLILDAKTMKEVARVKLPHPIPVGFHGFWKVNQ